MISLKEVVKLNPYHSAALFELGKLLLLYSHESKEALKCFKECLRWCDGFHEIYGLIGVAYYKIGKLDKAQRHFEVRG